MESERYYKVCYGSKTGRLPYNAADMEFVQKFRKEHPEESKQIDKQIYGDAIRTVNPGYQEPTDAN